MLPESLTGWRRRHATALRRAGVLAPLTLLSASWTLSVAAVGGSPLPIAAVRDDGPPALTVPDGPVEVPASLTAGRAVLPGTSRAVAVVATADAIPPVALAAYQRAEVIIAGADRACHLPWPVLAGIGRIESDHGRFGASVLDDDGVARPGIVGVALDGTRGTALVSDSDGGRYDGDKRFDRAVGPMQFIPTTWGVVGVDADGDGRRDPQDVDDAALAAAVYLCSGEENLDQPSGMRRALLRYNNSASYVDAVLAVARTYSDESLAPLAKGINAPLPGAIAAGATPVREARGGTARGNSAAAQPVQMHQPAPKPAEPKPSGGGDSGGVRPPAPEPSDTPLAPLASTLECTLTSLDRILQPHALATCLAKLGR